VHPALSRPRPTSPSTEPGRRRRRGVGAASLVAAAALVLSGCASDSGNTSPDDVQGQGYQSGDGSLRTWSPDERGDVVDLVGVDFEGNDVSSAPGDGEVVVLNTWYAACPPCRAEAADLLTVATERADDGVRFIGINGVDDAGAALAFEREHDITWPSIADTDGSVVASLQKVVPVRAVPTTVVLDRQGRVAARVLGQVDATTLDGLVEDALAEPAGA
jgi:peroxiredoxin